MTWREDEGKPGQRVAEAARSADLVITTSAQAASDATPDLVEALLTTAGVPVLVLPPNYVGDGRRAALVGWDGSREATRAVHAALPGLRELVFGGATRDVLRKATLPVLFGG